MSNTTWETTTWNDGRNNWIIEFSEKSHTYKIRTELEDKAQRAPSVTTILNALDFGKSGALSAWSANLAAESIGQDLHSYGDKTLPMGVIPGVAENARKAHTKRKDKAGDTGTIAHDWLEHFLLGENPPPPKDPQVGRIVAPAVEFFQQHDVQVLEVETRLATELVRVRYAGTVDVLAVVDGKVTLIDFKTSNHPSFTHALQMAGYDLAIDKDIEQYLVLYLDLKSTARCPQRDGYWERWVSGQEAQNYLSLWMTTLSLHDIGTKLKKGYAK